MDEQYDANQARIQEAGLPKNQKVKIDQVLSMLEGQRFYEWYVNTFEDYITGEEGCQSREQIVLDLKRLLG